MTIGGTNQELFILLSYQIAEFAARVWAVNTARVRFILIMTVPRTDALQNIGDKIFELEWLRKVSSPLASSWAICGQLPVIKRQEMFYLFASSMAANTVPSDKTLSAISRSTLVF